MHKIHSKPFELYDFSHEHLIGPVAPVDDMSYDREFGEYWSAHDILEQTITALNFYRAKYLETNDKKYWWQLIQLLPSSYNQRATVMLNYEVLANIYRWRKDHKQDEWREFCSWCKDNLKYSELFTGEYND